MNLFTTKKKNMSVYKPNVATTSYNNPLTTYGQKVSRGQGITAAQNAFKTPSVTLKPQSVTQPNMSVAPKTIQGSGMTSQYASNPTNYKPTATQPPATPTPLSTPQDPTNVFLQGLDQRTSQKQAFINQQKADQEKAINDRYNVLGQQIKSQLPTAENNFNVFKTNTMANIDAIKASGERQKSNAKDYYGEAQRLAAKTLGETKARDQRTFSNLNTIDSYGEGSFAQANENSTSDFNRYTQQNLKAQADKFAEIDNTVASAEREAYTIISQEEAKLETLKQQIQFALINNDMAQAEELRGVATQSQQLIFDLQDAVDGLKYQADLEKYKLQLEQTDTEGLSSAFLQTGTPQTQQDYIYRLKNADNYAKLFPNGGQNGQNNEKQTINNVISTLLNSDLSAISGIAGFRKPVFGSDAALTSNYATQLMGLLSLENRQKLRGQGTITDKEMAMLDKAASALGIDNGGRSNLTPEQLRSLLTELQISLGGTPQQKPSLDSFITG